MSSLAWIDFDESERQRAQRIMALFQERETRDELGLGGIRDSIADHLFPGTSTIQTRLRYMLFIPWIFRMLEGSSAGSDQLATNARALENRLANALKAGGESNGMLALIYSDCRVPSIGPGLGHGASASSRAQPTISSRPCATSSTADPAFARAKTQLPKPNRFRSGHRPCRLCPRICWRPHTSISRSTKPNSS